MTLPQIEVDIEHLRGLLGHSVRYQGVKCTIIEVLENDPSLVLEACHSQTIIQPDQHGEAHRRVPCTITVPILNKNRSEFTPAFLDLNIRDIEPGED